MRVNVESKNCASSTNARRDEQNDDNSNNGATTSRAQRKPSSPSPLSKEDDPLVADLRRKFKKKGAADNVPTDKNRAGFFVPKSKQAGQKPEAKQPKRACSFRY